MANRITPVKFHGATLITIDINGVAHVALRPICEAIGLDWTAQYDRIKRHPVLATCVVVTTTQLPRDKQRRDVAVLPLDKLNGWLFGVNAARVRPELRDKLIQFQRECFDVLHNHFVGVNKMVSKPALALPAPRQLPIEGQAAVTARTLEIVSAAMPLIHKWLTDQVMNGAVWPDGRPAANFSSTLAHADFAAFTTSYASRRVEFDLSMVEFLNKKTGELMLELAAKKAELTTRNAA